jgi:hypothetical protein
MSDLNDISDFCPHFPRFLGMFSCFIDPTKDKRANPFEYISRYRIEKECLLMEYIDNAKKFYDYILTSSVQENALYSIIKQTLAGVLIAQNIKHFTHYDLHSNNI